MLAKREGPLKAIRGAYYQDAGGRKGLPWDRIRHKSSPKAWVDVFLLVEYASLDELRKAVSTKRNGEPQATDEIEKLRNSALRYLVMRGPCIISASSIDGAAPVSRYEGGRARLYYEMNKYGATATSGPSRIYRCRRNRYLMW